MTEQEISDNAPEGATHVNHKKQYFWFDGDDQFIFKRKSDEWSMTFYHENKLDEVRSLADIKRIAELEKERVKLKKFIDFQGEVVENSDAEIVEKDKRITELEKERDEYHAMVVYMGAIMDESEGVAGYHLNGDVAKWDDLFTESLYKDAASVRDLEQQAKGIEDALSKWTLGDSRNIYDYLKDRAKALKEGK